MQLLLDPVERSRNDFPARPTKDCQDHTYYSDLSFHRPRRMPHKQFRPQQPSNSEANTKVFTYAAQPPRDELVGYLLPSTVYYYATLQLLTGRAPRNICGYIHFQPAARKLFGPASETSLSPYIDHYKFEVPQVALRYHASRLGTPCSTSHPFTETYINSRTSPDLAT